MTVVDNPALRDVYVDRDLSRWRVVHAENPNRLGYSLCNIKLTSQSSSPAGHRCLVCTDLARPSYVDR